MCGFAYIYHKKGLLDKNLAKSCAEEFIERRGPDYYSQNISKNEFVYQSVLAIQSNPQNNIYRFKCSDNWILYNGEIYSFDNGIFQKYEKSLDDIENFLNQKNLSNFLSKLDGMYAICKIIRKNNEPEKVEIYRDPSGEKHLFYYSDSEKFIISSVPGFIKEYCKLKDVNKDIIEDYLGRRHFISPVSLAVSGIKQLKPGTKIIFNLKENFICKESKFKNIDDFFDSELYEELFSYSYSEYLNLLERVLTNALNKMIISANKNNSSSIISGGIDSSLTTYLLNKDNLNISQSFCVDFRGKEKPSYISGEISKKCNIRNHTLIKPKVLDYKESLVRCIRLLAGPITTHSFASSMLIAEKARQFKSRIIYGGEGADELFLGYKCYSDLFNTFEGEINLKSDYTKYTGQNYSLNIQNELEKNLVVNNAKFLEKMPKKEAYIKSCALVDYNFQLSSVGFFANDISFSDYGIEARSVFARSEVLRLALSTPTKFLIENENSTCIEKKCLHDLFIKKIKLKPLSKSGFAGFPNETIEFLGEVDKWNVWDLLTLEKDFEELSREKAWKYINIEWFLRSL